MPVSLPVFPCTSVFFDAVRRVDVHQHLMFKLMSRVSLETLCSLGSSTVDITPFRLLFDCLSSSVIIIFIASLVFCARQHTMYPERDSVVTNPSVRPSVCLSIADTVSKRIDRHTF